MLCCAQCVDVFALLCLCHSVYSSAIRLLVFLKSHWSQRLGHWKTTTLFSSLSQESWQRGGPCSLLRHGGCWAAGSWRGHPWKEEARPRVPAREDSAGGGWRHAHRVPKWHWQRKRLVSFPRHLCLPLGSHSHGHSYTISRRFTLSAVMTRAPWVGPRLEKPPSRSQARWRWTSRWSRCRRGTVTRLRSKRTDQCTSGAPSGLVNSLLFAQQSRRA